MRSGIILYVLNLWSWANWCSWCWWWREEKTIFFVYTHTQTGTHKHTETATHKHTEIGTHIHTETDRHNYIVDDDDNKKSAEKTHNVLQSEWIQDSFKLSALDWRTWSLNPLRIQPDGCACSHSNLHSYKAPALQNSWPQALKGWSQRKSARIILLTLDSSESEMKLAMRCYVT